MAKQYDHIPESIQSFISKQKIFFVATARDEGRINLSPKGMDSLRVIDENRLLWLNLSGSGNETAAHLLKNDRMTIMFCSFEGKPLILRLYGHAKTFHPRDDFFKENISLFPPARGARQIIDMKVDLVQTSCGFAVPIMEFQEERTLLTSWADNKDEDQLKDYWAKKNSKSIDGFETGIFG